MRKNLVILFFMASASMASAQIRFGVKAGVNFSNITGTYFGDKPTMLVGFHLGGMMDVPLSTTFSFAPELLYSGKGAKAKTVEVETNNSGLIVHSDETVETDRFHYIEIPLLIMYRFPSGLHLEAGPYVAFLAGATYTGTETITDINEPTVVKTISVSGTDGLRSVDLGLDIGLGYRLGSGLGFSARYGIGLTDIYDPSYIYAYHNSVIMVSVDYMFGGK